MRRISKILLAIGLALIVSGCATTENKTLVNHVGLITEFGGPNDSSRNQLAYSGFKKAIQKKQNLQGKMLEMSADGANEEYLLRLLGSEGYSVVFFFDNKLGAKLDNVVSTYPKTYFVCMDNTKIITTAKNMQVANFDEKRAALMAGAAAGAASKSGKLAFADLSSSGKNSRYYGNFVAGAKALRPDCEVVLWNKADYAKRKSTERPDVVFVNGTMPAQFDFLKELDDNIKIITCGANIVDTLDKKQAARIIATIQKNTALAVEKTMSAIDAGKFENGVVEYPTEVKLSGKPFDAEKQQQYDKYCAAIVSGKTGYK